MRTTYRLIGLVLACTIGLVLVTTGPAAAAKGGHAGGGQTTPATTTWLAAQGVARTTFVSWCNTGWCPLPYPPTTYLGAQLSYDSGTWPQRAPFEGATVTFWQ